jgi:hypothetical protein
VTTEILNPFIERSGKASRMRGLLLTFALLISATTARADSLADLLKPSATIPGCINEWSALGDVTPTCEGEQALVEWNEHAAAITSARNAVMAAAHLPPDRTDPQAVINALNACAAAADAMVRLYTPAPNGRQDFIGVLAWMRPWFECQALPIPASVGDGLRILAEALAHPNLRPQDRVGLYRQAAVFVTRESQLAAYLGDTVLHQTDAAVNAAHRATLQAANSAENGHPEPNAAAAISAAAGPQHQTIAQEQTRQLNQSLAAHPDQGSYISRTGRALVTIPSSFFGVGGFALLVIVVSFRRVSARHGVARTMELSLRVLLALPLSWLPFALLNALTGWPDGGWSFLLWFALFIVLVIGGPRLLPTRWRNTWFAWFTPAPLDTHGSARFGRAQDAAMAGHLAPAAPADAFVLGTIRGVRREADPRFRQDGHILTCAPTGAGKGIGAVIPNLLDYPGSAFVLDIKGETYAVTARTRREAGQDICLVDPFGITGESTQAMNWLDTLNPDDPDVVSLAGTLADMLVVGGGDTDAHWNDTARELLRGLLVYVAALPDERRSMAELRRIVTASESDLADILADMLAHPERGHRLPARAANAYLNRPERERGSVLSTVVRHTAWLDDPRLCAALARSDFSLRDLKRKPMTVYLAIPPDRLRVCLGFVRGFIGLALDAITATPGQPAHRVTFVLDEFGQLGRMDRLADSITLLRGYRRPALAVRPRSLTAQGGLSPLAEFHGQHHSPVLRHR